jgi:hypothetical protein
MVRVVPSDSLTLFVYCPENSLPLERPGVNVAAGDESRYAKAADRFVFAGGCDGRPIIGN